MKKLLFLLMLIVLSSFSSYALVGSYSNQVYSNTRGYHYQQNYPVNYAARDYDYVPTIAFGRGNQPYYVIKRHNYGYNGNGPFLYPSRSHNPLFGSRTSYSSHFYIDSAIDQAYAKNPSMLEPRRMMNTQRIHSGFYY